MPASLQMECLSALRPIQRDYMKTAFPGLKYLTDSIFADVLRKNTGKFIYYYCFFFFFF